MLYITPTSLRAISDITNFYVFLIIEILLLIIQTISFNSIMVLIEII